VFLRNSQDEAEAPVKHRGLGCCLFFVDCVVHGRGQTHHQTPHTHTRSLHNPPTHVRTTTTSLIPFTTGQQKEIGARERQRHTRALCFRARKVTKRSLGSFPMESCSGTHPVEFCPWISCPKGIYRKQSIGIKPYHPRIQRGLKLLIVTNLIAFVRMEAIEMTRWT
jgi:hypothetical protein